MSDVFPVRRENHHRLSVSPRQVIVVITLEIPNNLFKCRLWSKLNSKPSGNALILLGFTTSQTQCI